LKVSCLRIFSTNIPGTANLSTWKIVAGSERRRVFVQCGLAISHGVIWKVREAEEAWLLWLALFFEVARVHCGRRSEWFMKTQMLDGRSIKCDEGAAINPDVQNVI
jgi:hypothetical protein